MQDAELWLRSAIASGVMMTTMMMMMMMMHDDDDETQTRSIYIQCIIGYLYYHLLLTSSVTITSM